MINKIIPILSTDSLYHHIDKSITELTSTLNQPELVHIATRGIEKTFSNPPIAFYKGDITNLNTLSLQNQNNLPNLPNSIPNGSISTFLCNNPSISIENRFILTSIQDTIDINEEQLLHHPGVVLWCPIVHAQGYLLGAFLIGMKSDLDPYRDQDLNELRKLLNATALALTNSAAYEQQQRSEALIRQLYQRLQESQDKIAADIARDIHDEVINEAILSNTQSISHIISNISDSHLHSELSLILETELSVIESLRIICQRLQPFNIEDPLGLPNIIRNQIQRLSALWDGDCELAIINTPIEIDPRVQIECMRITREALNNTIKHANATNINITIFYPSKDKESTNIIIRDNGKSANKIERQSGHFGIQNMYESARIINGDLQIVSYPGQGTTVTLTF
jgi:signal transduction histidine kinase